MSIEHAVRGTGVKWIENVDPYDLQDSMRVLRKAYKHDEGLRIIISRGECQLEKDRRERVVFKNNIKEGKRTVHTKLGVDPGFEFAQVRKHAFLVGKIPARNWSEDGPR